MATKKLMGAAAITVALAGGGLAGAVVGVPQLSGAATATSTTTTTPGGTTGQRPDRPGGPRGGAGIDAAAKAIGITADQLRTELKAGKTIAAVAKAKGVDLQKVIDAMVAADKAAIDERAAAEKEKVAERVTAQVNGTMPSGPAGGRPGGPGGPGGRGGVAFDAVAKALGITTDQLRTGFKDGKTVAAIAKEQGVDVQKVIDALVADANKAIDQRVTDGKLTAAEATTRKAEAKTRITDFVNKGFGAGGPGGPGGHRGPGGMGHPDDDGGN